MIKYALAHWRGEQSLARSFWINGVVFYLVLVVVLVGLGQIIAGQLFFNLGMAAFVICFAWSFIGIARSAVAVIRRPDRRFLSVVFAVASIVILALVAYLVVRDLQLLFK
jgi:hypothetical protein